MTTVLAWCPTCHTHHGPATEPCPPPGACPDCSAPGGQFCRPDCPRYAEPPGDEPNAL